MFKKGDKIRVSVAGGPWLDGVIMLSSYYPSNPAASRLVGESPKSLAVGIDEGLSPPFGVDKETGRQTMMLNFHEGRGEYVDIMDGLKDNTTPRGVKLEHV